MKRLMLTAAMILGFAGMTFAQSSASGDVTLNASVIEGLSLSISNSNLDLGGGSAIVAGTTPKPIDPKSASNIPYFALEGDGGHTVSVTYPSTVTLNGPKGAKLTFTSNFVGDNSNNQNGAHTVGSSVQLSKSSPTEGNYYFWLGGGVGAVPASQTPGSYTGEFTLQVNY